MSRNAVKFGRMSKKQREILQAEVQKHRLKEQRTEILTNPRGSNAQDTEQPCTSPRLAEAYPVQTWSNQNRWESSCSVHANLASKTHLQKDNVLHQPHSSEKLPTEATFRKIYFRDQQIQVEHSRATMFQRLYPVHNPETYSNLNYGSSITPEMVVSSTELNLLIQNVVLAHQETCRYRQDNLQVLRWETYSQEEVQSFQQKSMDQMWERCVCHVTEAIQYIVEFAKRLSGFMELNPNDQIVLLKAGVMEVLLIRMSRAFNGYNSTVFFEGKYAPLEIFQSLGCSDLIVSMFDLCHSLCALNLSEHEIAFISSMILLDPGRPWLQDKQKVEVLHKKQEYAFRYLLRTSHRESILSKLPQKGRLLNICHMHMEKLNVFRQMYPGIACESFPPLYKELFISEPETL
uniref:RAR related orphan receptor C n=1 Tax=Leptobrachium leishanense TaxID=445787 RepID=A0A8C5PWU4_9ANUR